jgi:putative hydrolase of the HAD superfamily
VVFDLFHTLLSGADEQRDVVVRQMAGVLGVEPEALVRAYHETWRSRLTLWDVEQTVRILAGRLGAEPTEAQVADAVALRHRLAARVLSDVPPSTMDTLRSLRAAGWRTGLVSNATADAAQAWPGSPLSTLIDAAAFSCEVGMAKPDPGIYLSAIGALGAEPAECVFVGDGADQELAGAAALGMTVIRTVEYHDNDPAWPGPTIAALPELPARLGAPDPR